MKRYALLLIVLSISTISQAQIISTFAGVGAGGYDGDSGLATLAHINRATGCDFDKEGNFYFSIRLANRVRKVSASGIITTIAGSSNPGFSGDSGLASAAKLNQPTDVAVDSAGNIFIADFNNQRIRKIDKNTGIITTVAGNGSMGFSGDNGLAVNASLNFPINICFDRDNNLYIADHDNQRIRKVNSAGIINTVAGNGNMTYTSDGGLADTTAIFGPMGVTCDSLGNLYISDYGNYRLRKVDRVSGIISTAVGNGIGVYNGEGINALATGINVTDSKIDNNGIIYLVDAGTNRIRKLDLSGQVYTVAGNGSPGYNGDSILATYAQLNGPEYIALDTCNNLYISDVQNQRIRKVTFDSSCGHTTSVNNITANTQFNIYPNPASNTVSIGSPQKINNVTIINLLGQCMYSKESNTNKLDIDVSGFANGVYFVKLNNMYVRKLVKQ